MKNQIILGIMLCMISFSNQIYSQTELAKVGEARTIQPHSNPMVKGYFKADSWVLILEKEADPGVKKENRKQTKAFINECGNIALNPSQVRNCPPTGDFIVNYSGFSTEAQLAFQYAVDIWSRVLELEIPIEIDAEWSALDPGVLGAAGPSGFYLLDDDIVYSSALSDQLVGEDIGGPDIQAFFSSAFDNWYFGLDGCPGPGEFDFVTVVLHEIGHGLGFLSTDFQFPAGFFPGADQGACFGFQGGLPYIFDLYLRNNSFFGDLANLTPGCYSGLEEYYTNDDLFFIGPESVACYGGPMKLYAPTTYRPGSSISHFDESSFPDVDPNSLMTPFVSRGEAVHDPGCALAVLRDLGFEAADEVPECTPVPTMGQWGLMSLSLLLLIMGVLSVRQRQLIFN